MGGGGLRNGSAELLLFSPKTIEWKGNNNHVTGYFVNSNFTDWKNFFVNRLVWKT